MRVAAAAVRLPQRASRGRGQILTALRSVVWTQGNVGSGLRM